MSVIKLKFKRFHRENPEVYRLFCQYANEAFRSGLTDISSKLVIERIRWEQSVKTGEVFRINNNFTAYYARLYMHQFPGRAQFRFRKIRS